MTGSTSIADPRNPQSLSARFRKKRKRELVQIIRRLASGSRPFRILDVGGRPEYWLDIGEATFNELKLDVECTNLDPQELDSKALDGRIRTFVANGCSINRTDDSYDFVHSNSVIEHVGNFVDMGRFAAEVRRLAPAYYIQTPYFWFPLDPHFFRFPIIHWMPEPLQLEIVRRVSVGHSRHDKDIQISMDKVQSRSMLSLNQFEYLFPDAVHSFERFALLPKSMIAVREHRSQPDLSPIADGS